MDTLMSAVESITVLAAGLAIRAGLLLVVLAVLSVPVMLLLTGVRGVDAVRRRLLGVMRIGGLSWSNQAFYAPGHTWIRRTGRNRVELGLDDLAQRLFPTPTGLRLPQPGTKVQAHQPMGEVRTMGRRAALVSPVNGVVTTINRAVVENPSLVHRDPYARGWLMTITPSDDAYEQLPRGEAAKTWLRSEGHRLSRFFEVQLGAAAADGGEFVTPPPTMLSDQQWATLTREFLANP
jgi:glycine cleavage system H protein